MKPPPLFTLLNACLAGSLMLASCAEEKAAETWPSPLVFDANTSSSGPNFIVGTGHLRRSHYLTKWFGLSTDQYPKETPPQILGDLRDAFEVSTPSHFTISFDLEPGGLHLQTAVRRIPDPANTHAEMGPIRCEVFLRQQESLLSLAMVELNLPLEAESGWSTIDIDLPLDIDGSTAAGTLEFVSRWQQPSQASQAGPLVAWAAPVLSRTVATMRPDVLLLSIDTLRSDALDDAPQLSASLAECALWPQAVAPSSWTLPAYASLFTGKLPDEHGAGRAAFSGEPGRPGEREFHPLQPGIPTLAEQFAAAGYATGLIHQNPFLEPWSGLDRGFSTYQRCNDEPGSALGAASRWWQTHRNQPRFLVVHLIGPHLPYSGDDPLAQTNWRDFFNLDHSPQQRRQFFMLSPEIQDQVRAAYSNEVRRLDQQLGPWLKQMMDTGEVEVFGFHADHGEELWDYGSFEHGHAFNDAVVRVPVAVYGPGIDKGKRSEAVGAHWLGGSLLQLAGLAAAETWGNNLDHTGGETRTVGSLYRTEIGGRIFNVATNESRPLPLEESVSGSGPLAQPDQDLLRALRALGYF